MERYRRVAPSIAVLVVLMLATIGGWEIFKRVVSLPPALAQEGPPLDHFECYKINQLEGSTFVKRILTTMNAFGAERLKILSPDLLCVPTAKTTDEPLCGEIGVQQCGGACPRLDQQCQFVEMPRRPHGGVCRCVTAPTS